MTKQIAPVERASESEPKHIAEAVIRILEEYLPKSGFHILDTSGIADHLGTSERTIVNWTNRGLIPSFTIGKCRRYDLAEVVAALKSQEPAKTEA